MSNASCLPVALAVLALLVTQSSRADVVETDHLRSQLVAESASAVPGAPLRIGLLLEHDPEWHSYWRNPGDSGLATRLTLTLPEGVRAGEIAWPAPARFEVDDLVNFGYGDRVLLPLTLEIPADFRAATLEISARASWLVCKTECIPGRGEYRLSLPVARESSADVRWADAFAAADARLPRTFEGEAQFSVDDARVQVELRGPGLPPDIAAWTVFPVVPQMVANAAWPTWSRIEGGLRLTLPRSESFAGAPARFPLVLAKDGAAIAVDALPTPPDR